MRGDNPTSDPQCVPPETTISGETLTQQAALASAAVGQLPALTIVAHPDPDRVGQRSVCHELLDGEPVAVSRTTRSFAHPNDSHGRPLADRYLSRSPVRLVLTGERVTVDASETRTEVMVNGAALTGSRAEFERSAEPLVLRLANRVGLLLHWIDLPRTGLARHGLVGESSALTRVRAGIDRVADLDVPVLLRGESGTGKELVAQAIHAASRRRERPLAIVNMAAMTPSTAASELFGHRRGAFTGARSDHRGWFQRADGGTLFLDEVGATPAAIQPMLLRVLESGEIQPVGGDTSTAVDVRLIAATDAELERQIEAGDFKLPLLHRLAGYELHLPPLRERRDDIPRLLRHFLSAELARIDEAEQHGAGHLPPSAERSVPPALMERLLACEWPGNVRQLRNVARQLAISSRGMERLTVDPSVERLLSGPTGGSPRALHTGGTPAPPQLSPAGPAKRPKPDDLREDELEAALKAHGWRIRPAARALGLPPATMYSLIDRSPGIRRARDIDDAEIQRCGHELGWDLDAMSGVLKVSKRALRTRIRALS